MAKETEKRKPDWKVLTRRGDTLGSSIGIGFNHSSNKGGITFLLNAAPIPNESNQIELVVFPFSGETPSEV